MRQLMFVIVVAAALAGAGAAPGAWLGRSAHAVEGQACQVQEDCPTGFYCHFSPMCGLWNETGSCPGDCQSTAPGQEGDVCNRYRQCADGLVCCYPCGIAGCENRCAVPCSPGPGCFHGCYLYP